MPKLPNPETVNRRTASPGGVSGQLRGSMVPDIAPDNAIADALGNIGDEAYKYQMKEKARMDQVAFDDAKNQYMQQELELKKEVAGIKGKEAVDRDIDKEYTTRIDGISESISSNLKNNSQKGAWNSYFGKAKIQFKTGIMKHKLSESDSYAQQTNSATVSTNQQAAISNPSNGRIVKESEDAIKVSVARELVRTGNDKDPNIVNYEINKALVPLWHGVITAQIDNGKYGTANELLEEKKKMLGENYGNLVKYMETKKTTEESQNIADDVFATIDGDQEQINKIRKDYSGKLEELSLKQIKIRQEERDAQARTKELKKRQAEIDAENVVLAKKNKMANDLFEFEKNKDFNGRLNYIESISPEFGGLKRKELDLYEKDLKASKEKKTKAPIYSEAENELRDKIMFEPGSVTEEEIREIGRNTDNRAKLFDMYTQSMQKGEVQKKVESRVRKYAEDILESDDGVLWFGLSDKEIQTIGNNYYKHLDTIREYFIENPKATFQEANSFYDDLVKPEIAEDIVNIAVNKPASTPTKIPIITSKKEYDKILSGALYINNGKQYRKK